MNIETATTEAVKAMRVQMDRMEHALRVIAEWAETVDEKEAAAGLKGTAALARRALGSDPTDRAERIAREMAVKVSGNENRWPCHYVAACVALNFIDEERERA